MLEKVCSSTASLKHIILLEEIGGESATSDLTASDTCTNYDDLMQMRQTSDVNIAKIELSVKPNDILNLQFTSGSTGRPKSASLTHRGMLNSARYIGA